MCVGFGFSAAGFLRFSSLTTRLDHMSKAKFKDREMLQIYFRKTEIDDYAPRHAFQNMCATFLSEPGISIVYDTQGSGKTTAIVDLMSKSLDTGVVCGVLFCKLRVNDDTDLQLNTSLVGCRDFRDGGSLERAIYALAASTTQEQPLALIIDDSDHYFENQTNSSAQLKDLMQQAALDGLSTKLRILIVTNTPESFANALKVNGRRKCKQLEGYDQLRLSPEEAEAIARSVNPTITDAQIKECKDLWHRASDISLIGKMASIRMENTSWGFWMDTLKATAISQDALWNQVITLVDGPIYDNN